MADVTCLGIIVADAVVRSVDELPEEGKLQLVNQLELHTGGCAANTAIDLAKIGIKPAVVGKVGSDGFGSFMINEFNKHKVDIEGVKVVDGINTSSSVVIINSKGERSFLHCLGSNAEFTEEDVDFSVIEKSKILFVAGALLMPKLDGEPTARILKKARELGVFTALDTAWDSTGRWMKAIEPCLPYLDLFIPSIEEAEMLSNKKDTEEIADLFLAKGVGLVVLKLGKKGCFIKSCTGEKYSIPAITDICVEDTNGAGDSFVAGFLTGIINGWDIQRCGKFANAVGAHCVMKVGASSGIKSMEEILQFIAARE